MAKDVTPNQILMVLFIGVLMAALDLAIVGPALPAIQADFGVDNRSLAWIFTIYVLFNLISTPLMAKLSDRFGRRAIYQFDVALFGAGSLIVAAAPDFNVLLLGRAVQAIGAGGIFPVATAVIGDTFPAEKRGGALGLIGAVFGIAFLLGPLLGGLLLRFSWHWLFLINLPIAAFLIWRAFAVLPAAGSESRSPFDLAGAVLLSVLLAAFAIALTQLDSARLPDSLMSLEVAPYLLVAVVLLPIFWIAEKRAADPIIRPSLFNSRQIRLTGLIAVGAGTVEAATVFFPALAVAALGVTEANASLLMLPSVLALAVGSPLVGRSLNRAGSRLLIQIGLVLVASGTLLYALADLNLVLFVLGGILGGLGLSALLGAPFRYIMLNEAGERDRAAAQGLLTVFLSIGQLGGAAVVGGVAASRGGGTVGYQSALLVLGVFTGLLVLVAIGLKGRQQETSKPAAGPAE